MLTKLPQAISIVLADVYKFFSCRLLIFVYFKLLKVLRFRSFWASILLIVIKIRSVRSVLVCLFVHSYPSLSLFFIAYPRHRSYNPIHYFGQLFHHQIVSLVFVVIYLFNHQLPLSSYSLRVSVFISTYYCHGSVCKSQYYSSIILLDYLAHASAPLSVSFYSDCSIWRCCT
jgi:hypothetical protein